MASKQSDSYLRTLPASTIAQSSKYLACLSRAKLKCGRGLGLQPRNCTTKLQHSLGLIHTLALVDDVLHPIMRGFDLASHVRELLSNDRMIDKPLAEGLALVGVFDGFFVADAREADTLDDYTYALMVEIRHDDCVV